MAKKSAKTTNGQSLQSVCNTILDKAGTLTGTQLVTKVHATRPDAKEGSIKQALAIWKKRKGLTKPGKVMRTKPGRTAASDGRPRAATNLMETLRRVTALAAVIDLPQEQLPEIIKALS